MKKILKEVAIVRTTIDESLKINFRSKEITTTYTVKSKVYKSISKASKKTGIDPSNISKASRGIRNSAGGYFWTKAEEYDF